MQCNAVIYSTITKIRPTGMDLPNVLPATTATKQLQGKHLFLLQRFLPN